LKNPTAPILDALGQGLYRAGKDARIVSLVPSLTELLIDLGLQKQLVGRTGFCIHPTAAVADIPKVGGTKDVNVQKIRRLAPSHVIVNVDENERDTVDLLRTFVPHVIVTHPHMPQDNLALYAMFGGLFDAHDKALDLQQRWQSAFDSLQRHVWPRQRVLYLIWQDPWMTVARDTYISRMLALVNWQTWPDALGGPGIISDDRASCTMGGSARYPQLKFSETLMREIDLVLLSTEPYSFRQVHADVLETRLGKTVLLMDGEMTSWYGSRAIAGMQYLADFAGETMKR
jgi:ABC-type Fe3+-hydroxamate transport system substrate-binding protein